MDHLTSGVLVKLLNKMTADDYESVPPTLLQIRSIIPVMAEADLWPNQGFFIKISDSSHSMYVSLPQEHDELVLSNKLQIGQFIYVEKFETAYPVPIVRGIKLVPGRYPCVGNPQDLVVMDNLVNKGDRNGVERKTRNHNRFRSLSASKAHPSGVGKEASVTVKGFQKISLHFAEKDAIHSLSASLVKRRSWNGTERNSKPAGSSRSACASPIRPARYDTSDENSSSKTKRRDNHSIEPVRSSIKSRVAVPVKRLEDSEDPSGMTSLVNNKRWTESEILWNVLPSTLVKLGKDVLRQRDAALRAAIEALQEASANERSLKCLSTFSGLMSANKDDKQQSLDKFFNLRDDLTRTRLIIQSLTNISPVKANNTDLNSSISVKEALKLALERKKNATSWIKSALASDLAPSSNETTATLKRASTCPSYGAKPKGSSCIIRKQKNNGDQQVGLVIEDDTEDLRKGRALCAGLELTNSLLYDSRRWFLAYAEDYLDEVKSKTIDIESNSEITVKMHRIKRINDWLDKTIKLRGSNSLKHVCDDNWGSEDSEVEAYGRVRNKIFEVLLKHVERTTTMDLENTNPMTET